MVAINRLVKKRLGEMLVEQGLLTNEQVQDALRMQHQSGLLFGETLVQNNLITEEKIVAVLVSQFGIPYILPSQYQVSKDLLEIFEPTMMRRYQFVPMDSIGSVLVIAFAGWRYMRATQMTTQYRWLYERSGPFAWRTRSGA